MRNFIVDELRVYSPAEFSTGVAVPVEQAWAQAVPMFVNEVFRIRDRIHGDRPTISEAVYEGVSLQAVSEGAWENVHTFRLKVRVKNPEHVDA